MSKKNIYGFVVLVGLIVIASYIPLLLSEETMNFFVREDALYEWLSPIYLAVASIMFFIALFRSRGRFQFNDSGLRKLALLGFAGIFIVAAFEEISWGQRVANFATPNFIEEVNVQKEITVHNLKFFQGEDAVFPLDFDQLAAIFALTLGFLIPTACALLPRLDAFLRPKFPILPVQFGGLYVLNYAIQKLAVRILPLYPELYHNTTRKIPAVVHEIREHNYALLLMVSAIFFVVIHYGMKVAERKKEPVQAVQQPRT